jgi:hypothetical protein
VCFQVINDLLRFGQVSSIANDETPPAGPTDTAVSQPPGVTRKPDQCVSLVQFLLKSRR